MSEGGAGFQAIPELQGVSRTKLDKVRFGEKMLGDAGKVVKLEIS